MNWEVPTMQSKTSCSNASLFRRCLKRYWPLTFVMAVALLLFIAFPIADQLSYLARSGEATTPGALHNALMGQLASQAGFSAFYAALFALAAAMAVFEHTYSPKLTGLFAALPVRREKIFASHWLAGLWMLLIPGLVTALAVFLIALSFGAADASILAWFGVWALESAAFFGIAVFCVMLTGHVLVIPALYALVNFAGSSLSLMLSGLVGTYTYGVNGVSGELDWMHTLSPLVRLMTSVGARFDNAGLITGIRGWGWAVAYAIVGLILSALALLLFQKRQNECAQETTSFPVLRPILKYIVTAFFALGFPFIVLFFLGGYSFYGDADRGFFLLHLALTLIGAVIGYFFSEMIIRKSLNAFSGKGLLKALIVGLLACALVCAFRFDAFGIAGRVPAAENVQSAQLEVNGERFSLTDRDGIDACIALHREILAEHENGGSRSSDDGSGANCYLNYLQKDGSVLSRTYQIPAVELLDRLKDMLNSEPLHSANVVVTPPVPVDAAHIDEIWIDLPTGAAIELYGEEAAAFYRDVILPDIAEGHYGVISFDFDNDVYERTHYGVNIGVSLRTDDNPDNSVTIFYEPSVETAHTNAWLESFGVTLTPIADQRDG